MDECCPIPYLCQDELSLALLILAILVGVKMKSQSNFEALSVSYSFEIPLLRIQCLDLYHISAILCIIKWTNMQLFYMGREVLVQGDRTNTISESRKAFLGNGGWLPSFDMSAPWFWFLCMP